MWLNFQVLVYVYERGGTGDDGEEGGELSENLIFLLH
jgi:hypothetical protein